MFALFELLGPVGPMGQNLFVSHIGTMPILCLICNPCPKFACLSLLNDRIIQSSKGVT